VSGFHGARPSDGEIMSRAGGTEQVSENGAVRQSEFLGKPE
jgi:hypothetical protein